MNFGYKRVLILFLVLVVINLTPAFATQMEDVADDAQAYNKESMEKKGFFAKIKFMVKGFKLLDETKKAEKNTKEQDKEDGKEESTDEKFNNGWYKQIDSENQKKNSLNYRNRDINSTNSINNSNSSNNDTNGTMKSPDSDQQVFSQDIDTMIQYLQKEGIILTSSLENDITHLGGCIVQLVDEKGNIRYAYVESMQITDEKQEVALITDNNHEMKMSLNEFKKSYTGHIMSLGSVQSPETVMGAIVNNQKNILQEEKSNAKNLKDKFRDKTITGGILLGIGVILAVVGTLLIAYFGQALFAQYNQLLPSATHTIEIASDKWMLVMDDMRFFNRGVTITPAMVIELMYEWLDDGAPIALLEINGFSVTAIATSKILLNLAAQNWVKVILLVVGLILALVGIGLIIAGLVMTVKNGIKLRVVNKLLDKIQNRNEELENWQENSTPIISVESNETLNNNGDKNKLMYYKRLMGNRTSNNELFK
jgi:hypothetical protein